MKEGITIIEDTEYYFDGYCAYPIKCKCGGDILERTEGTIERKFNHELKHFEDIISENMGDAEYVCYECLEEYDTMILENGELV